MEVTKAQHTIVRRNSNNSPEKRARRLNIIEDSNIDVRVRSDSTNNELDISLAANKFRMGVWTGSATPASVDSLESDYGVTFDYQQIYQAIGYSIDYTDVVAALDAGRDVMYVVQFGISANAANLADIAGGTFDASFNSICDSVVADGREITMAIMHEFNGDDYPWAIYKSGNDAGDFVTAYQRIVGLARAKNAPIKFVQWYLKFNKSYNPAEFSTYYAGDDYVDIVACTNYNRAGLADYSYFHSFDHGFDQWYQAATQMSKNPIMVGETSSTDDASGIKSQFIRDTFDTIRTRYPRLKYLTWFLEDKSGAGSGNWSLQTQAQEDAFTDGWRELQWGKDAYKVVPPRISRNLILDPLLTSDSYWTQSGTGAGTLSLDSDVPYIANSGAKSLKLTEDGNSGDDYTNELYQSRDDTVYTTDTQYTLSFWARASVDGAVINCGIKQDTSPNTARGFLNLKLTEYWKFYRVVIDTSYTDTVWRIPDFRVGHNSSACNIYLWGIKWEKGNAPTYFMEWATDTINESNSGAGVTIDGVLLKDGVVTVPTIPTAGTDAVNKTYVDKAYPMSFLAPSGAVGENIPRELIYTPAGLTSLSTGRISLFAIALRKGTVVTSITFRAGATALVTGANQWFALFDGSRNKLAITADDTSTAWAGNTNKTLTLTSPYTITVDGLYYVGIMVKADTVPTLLGLTSSTNLTNQAPILAGYGDSSLTNPASCPNPVTALTALTGIPYIYVS